MTEFSVDTCSGMFYLDNENWTVRVTGNINDSVSHGIIKYVAASPFERRASYTGSGLPFANSTQAFENTENSGELELKRNNGFDISVKMPNSYYVGLGTYLVPPTVYIVYNNGFQDKIVGIKVANSIPYRMLTYPSTQTKPRDSPSFYDVQNLPVRTQEQILRDSAYPCAMNSMMAKNFWGLKPPL